MVEILKPYILAFEMKAFYLNKVLTMFGSSNAFPFHN